jgi:hypothetical protein
VKLHANARLVLRVGVCWSSGLSPRAGPCTTLRKRWVGTDRVSVVGAVAGR